MGAGGVKRTHPTCHRPKDAYLEHKTALGRIKQKGLQGATARYKQQRTDPKNKRLAKTGITARCNMLQVTKRRRGRRVVAGGPSEHVRRIRTDVRESRAGSVTKYLQGAARTKVNAPVSSAHAQSHATCQGLKQTYREAT